MSRTALYRLPLESIEKRRTVRTGDINLPCWSNTRSPVSYHSQQLVFRCHSSLNMAAIGHVAYFTGHLQACHEALLYLPFCCVSVKRKENKTVEAVTKKKRKKFSPPPQVRCCRRWRMHSAGLVGARSKWGGAGEPGSVSADGEEPTCVANSHRKHNFNTSFGIWVEAGAMMRN